MYSKKDFKNAVDNAFDKFERGLMDDNTIDPTSKMIHLSIVKNFKFDLLDELDNLK